jgi:uncharacterized cupredoxin-like copper-binding protein
MVARKSWFHGRRTERSNQVLKLSFGVIASVVLVVSVGAMSAGAVTSKPLVAVQVDEFSVFPATQGAPVGKVRFVVTNIGKIEHEFVVIKTTKPAGNLLKGNEASETGAVGELDGVKPGNARVLVLSLTKGHYALICNLPGHYRTGQFADFYVR